MPPQAGTQLAPQEAGERGGGRPGGIPRNLAERGRGAEEGTEEGLPDASAQPQIRAGQPRILPPPSEWKLGIWGYNTDSGVVITRVLPGGPAARRGLERGDKIVTVGGYQVGFVGDWLYPLGYELQRQVDRRGDVLLLVQNVRNSELQNLTVNLGRSRTGRPPRTGSFPVEPN